MNYKNIFKHIYDKGCQGIVGMEHGNSLKGKAGERAVIDAYVACDDFLCVHLSIILVAPQLKQRNDIMEKKLGEKHGKYSRLTRREMITRTSYALAGLTLAASCGPFSSGASGLRRAESSRRGFKIGIVDWELGKKADPSALELAERLGFDGVQVDLGGVEAMRRPEAQRRYLELAKRFDVEIASLALGILNQVPYASDPRGQELVDAGLDICQAMGQKVILLAFFGKGDLRKPENSINALVEQLKEIAPKAERAGIELGVEAHISVEQYMDIIEGVGSPAVKVYFDMVHAHGKDRDVYQEITFLGEHICEFHAKDYGNIMFGQGDLDFKEVRRAMDDIGYRGWIQVEQWNEIKGEKPLGMEETNRRNLQYLRGIFPPEA